MNGPNSAAVRKPWSLVSTAHLVRGRVGARGRTRVSGSGRG